MPNGLTELLLPAPPDYRHQHRNRTDDLCLSHVPTALGYPRTTVSRDSRLAQEWNLPPGRLSQDYLYEPLHHLTDPWVPLTRDSRRG